MTGYDDADLEPKATLKGAPWGWEQETRNHSPFKLKLATTWNSQGTTYLRRPAPEMTPGSGFQFLYQNRETGHGPQSFAVYDAYDPRTNAYVGSVVVEAQTDCEAVAKVDGIPTTCIVWHVASFATAAAIPDVFLTATSDTTGIQPFSLRATTFVVGDMRPPPPPVPTTTTTTEPVRVKTTTALSAAPTGSRLGEPVQLAAVVKASVSGATVPTGSVEFTDGTRSLGRATLVGGATQADATVEVSDLGIGSHDLAATYTGDATNVESRAGVTFEVRKPAPVLHLTPSANPSPPGTPVMYRVAVVTGLPALPQGEVVVADAADPKNRFSVQLSGGGGSGQLPTPLTPGVHQILATWLDESKVSRASTTVDQRVLGSAATTTSVTASTDRPLWGQSVAYTATVAASDGVPVSGGTVVFTLAGQPYGKPVALRDGTATTKPAPMKLDLGRYPVTATFEPGSDPSSSAFASSQGSVNGGVIVQPSPTVVQLVASDSQSPVGDPVTVWVTVTGVESLADGTVAFRVDGKSVPVLVTLVHGQGSILIGPGFWTAGRHTVSAEYVPDEQHYLPSTGSLPHDVVARGSSGGWKGGAGAPARAAVFLVRRPAPAERPAVAAPRPRPSKFSRTWARRACRSRWVMLSTDSSSPNPALNPAMSGAQSSWCSRPSWAMIRSPCLAANISAIASTSPNRSRSGARVAMAPSRNIMFFTNSMSSLGSRAPSPSSVLMERCISATSSSGVSVVGSTGGRSRPSRSMTCCTSTSSGKAPRSRNAATSDGMSPLDAPTRSESSARRLASVRRAVMPKSSRAIFPDGGRTGSRRGGRRGRCRASCSPRGSRSCRRAPRPRCRCRRRACPRHRRS